MMMEIVVCVGKTCREKGACNLIKGFQKLIEENNLEDITVSASCCLGSCSRQGVAVQFGDEFISGVTANNMEAVFARYVLQPVVCTSRC